MKTRTRRFKVVSYLVLLTMIVSLFGPMGTMKKVMADDVHSFIFENGQWYSNLQDEAYQGDEIQEVLTDNDRIIIVDNPQEAFASLGTAVRNLRGIFLSVDPETDCVIPANIKPETLVVEYEPSSTGTYIYSGDLGHVSKNGGNLSINGNIIQLDLGSKTGGRGNEGKMEVLGNVQTAEWYKKTEAIASENYAPGYEAEEMNRSIAGCDDPETAYSYFTGDFTIQGKVDNLYVRELYFNAGYDRFYFPIKAQVSDFTSTLEKKPMITAGQLASDIPVENLNIYSTSEWVQMFLEHNVIHYNVSYYEGKYCWYSETFIDGENNYDAVPLSLGPDHMPLDVDLNGAIVNVYSTAEEGITFPADCDLLSLTVNSGTVTVQGDVSSLCVEDKSRFNFMIDPGCFLIQVQGDVSELLLNDISANTNVIVDGNVAEARLKTLRTGEGLDVHEDFATFSKSVSQPSEIMGAGSLNREFMISTGEEENTLTYSIDETLAEIEVAAGVTDETRAIENEAVGSNEDLQYQSAGARLLLKTLDEETVQAIESEVDLEDGYQVTNRAVDIKVGTFYTCGGLKPSQEITSTSEPLHFNIVIPDYKEDVEYGIVRVHDNGDGTTSYDVLDTTVTEGVISFASDKFSDFVIINDDVVEPADVTAPVLSAGSFERTSHTEGTATFTSTEAGDFFYELVAKGEAEPEIDTDYDGEVCVAGSNSIVNPYGMEEGAMDLYVKVKDAAGNVSDTLKIGMAEYNSLPSFENSTVSINCSSTSLGLDITDFLAAIDDDNDQTLTWTMKQAPSHGELTMTNATALSGGVNLIVNGSIVYQPDKNYCGTDQFVIQVSDGVATADCQVTMNVTDQTAPTATIKEGTNEWKSFLNIITFGLFFKNTLNVSIEAADDGGSGLKTVEYYKSATALTLEEIQNLANWTTYTSTLAINPVDKNQVIIYAKVTDNAGNVSYVCTDGMEFDTVAPSISNNYQKDATSMEVTVADNGSGVNAVSYSVANGTAQTAVLTNGKFTIPSLEEGRYNVVVTATDKVGNISSQTIPVVSLYTVNFYYGELINLGPVKTEVVEYGNDATAPIVAKRPGFDFVGWNKSFTKVVSDIDVDALWNLTGVTVTPYVGTYDGKSHDMISIAGLNPSDVVTYSVDGDDYSTDCPSLTNVGSHSVYVKIDRDGLDTWISPEYTVTVAQKPITLAMISEIPPVEFNGEHFCPVPVVKDGTVTLKNGTDYTLSYTNNRNSGIAYVNVVGKGNYAGTVQASFRILEKKSEVKVKDKETPEVSVPNLSKLYEDEAIYTPEDRQIEENGGSVKVELAVQTQVVSIPDQKKIKEMAKDKKIGLFLDISLFKVVQQAGQTSGSTSQISHTNQLLSIVIPIPNELKGRKGIELYRVHNGVPSIIPIGAENAIDGEYCTIDSENITLYVKNFSTYAIGYSTSSITSPKTGEESSQLPWILLGLGLAAAGVVVLKKSRRVRISK